MALTLPIQPLTRTFACHDSTWHVQLTPTCSQWCFSGLETQGRMYQNIVNCQGVLTMRKRIALTILRVWNHHLHYLPYLGRWVSGHILLLKETNVHKETVQLLSRRQCIPHPTIPKTYNKIQSFFSFKSSKGRLGTSRDKKNKKRREMGNKSVVDWSFSHERRTWHKNWNKVHR